MWIREVAAVLGISRGTAYEPVHRSELRSVRLGRRLVVVRHVRVSLPRRTRPANPEYGVFSASSAGIVRIKSRVLRSRTNSLTEV